MNHVFRGTVLPVESRALSPEAQDTFFADFEIPILHPDELYGSKLVAAMDRQHPRDLFDVLMLYQRGGLTEAIVECLTFCLIVRSVLDVLPRLEDDSPHRIAGAHGPTFRKPTIVDQGPLADHTGHQALALIAFPEAAPLLPPQTEFSSFSAAAMIRSASATPLSRACPP